MIYPWIWIYGRYCSLIASFLVKIKEKNHNSV